MQTQFTSPYVHKKIIPALNRDWDRKQAQDDKSTKALGFAPTADHPRWSFDQIAAAEFYLSQRDKGHKREMAGRLATQLHRAMQDHPTADQFTVVTLANGSTSIHPTADLDLSTGFVSGGCVETALMIEVRGLREKVARAIEEAASVVGTEE
ncbi:hypothetical protein [uncultured Sphingomonas sp.]|uniref:hypothetical protein n=1 Tax=uncultured Sphingomonas sp. TaxID=158754 RepID=UPI0025F85EB6|nr:hypothetical protein [uncultured Sphingomonas sp.]